MFTWQDYKGSGVIPNRRCTRFLTGELGLPELTELYMLQRVGIYGKELFNEITKEEVLNITKGWDQIRINSPNRIPELIGIELGDKILKYLKARRRNRRK